jgi:hypothetical protein
MSSTPDFYKDSESKDLRLIDYGAVLKEASSRKLKDRIKDSVYDKNGKALVLFDFQNMNIEYTDKQIAHICNFIYENVSKIKDIFVYSKSPNFINMFSPIFWVDSSLNHPKDGIDISLEDFKSKRWKVSDGVKSTFSTVDIKYVTKYLQDYFNKYKSVKISEIKGYNNDVNSSTITALQEALFYFTAVRNSPVVFSEYGFNPLVEYDNAFHKHNDFNLAFIDNYWQINDLKQYSQLIFAGLDSKFLLENIKYCNTEIESLKSFYLLKHCSVLNDSSSDFKKLKTSGLNIFYNNKEFR